MTRLFKLGFGFHLGLLILWEDSIFDFDCKYTRFHSLELISAIFLLQHVFLSRLLHQLSCCGIFICCTSYSVIAPFYYFTVLAIILVKPFFCPNILISLLLSVLFLTQTNLYLAISIYTYTLFLMFCKKYILYMYM